jgi:hypothetical protein
MSEIDTASMSQEEYEAWTLDEELPSKDDKSSSKPDRDARSGRTQYSDRSAKECQRSTNRK